MLIGVVSDTHGLLRPQLLPTLRGVDHILHAGDVGDPAILAALARLAPVTAIRGNVDTHGPCATLPPTEAVELAGRLFYLVHSLEDLEVSPSAAGISVVVSGHSHRAESRTQNGVLYLNPGSAGPRRFALPVTLALVTLTRDRIANVIVDLLNAP